MTCIITNSTHEYHTICSLHASDVPDDANDYKRLSHGVVLAIMEAPLDGPDAVDRDGDEGEDRRERHAVVEEDPKAAENLFQVRESTLYSLCPASCMF